MERAEGAMGGGQRNPEFESESLRESEDMEPELDDGCDVPYIRLST